MLPHGLQSKELRSQRITGFQEILMSVRSVGFWGMRNGFRGKEKQRQRNQVVLEHPLPFQ